MTIGNYEILGELGRGGVSIVYRARDTMIGREVAIKVIRDDAHFSEAERQAARLRFAREAAAAGRLSHPNIVTVYHTGEEGAAQYLVMELVDGQPLSRLMTPVVPFDPADCNTMLHQLADALDYAHSNGVFHRDIKPGNILVASGGIVKITDFGIARISAQSVTRAGEVIGNSSYMAPEQITGGRVDGATDQFALAVVAFELLTGRKPFPQTGHATMFAVVSGDRPDAHSFNPALHPTVSAVLQRGMAKEGAARFQSCAEFVDSLELAFSGVPPIVERTAALPLQPPAPEPVPATPAAPPSTAPRSRVPIAVWILAPIACLALGIGLYALLNSNSTPSNPSTPAQQPTTAAEQPATPAPKQPATKPTRPTATASSTTASTEPPPLPPAKKPSPFKKDEPVSKAPAAAPANAAPVEAATPSPPPARPDESGRVPIGDPGPGGGGSRPSSFSPGLSPNLGAPSGGVLYSPSPVYPPPAREARVQGLVRLRATVGKDGSVTAVEVLDGNPMLAPAAVDAVKQWKYKPTGSESAVTVELRFTLGQ